MRASTTVTLVSESETAGNANIVTKRAWGAEIQNREEKFELKRRAVLASAARFIRRVGFDKLSLADIAIDLNVAKPTIYYYFRNKEQIVRELMEIAMANFMNVEDHPDDNPDADGLTGAERFERFIRRSVRVTCDEIGACLFIVYPSQLSPDVRRELDAIGQPVIDCAERILRAGLADGSIAPCDPATVYNFMINGLRALPLLLETHRGGTLEQMSDAVVAMMLHGIAARP